MSSTGNLSRGGGLTLCVLRSLLTYACCKLKETSLSSKEDEVVWVVLRSAQYCRMIYSGQLTALDDIGV